MLGMHFTALGRHHVLVGAFFYGQGRGMLVDADAESGHRTGDAADVFQRMEMEGVALKQAAEIALGLEHLFQLPGRDVVPVHAVGVLHQFARCFETGRIVEPVGEDHALVHQVAVDAVLPDAGADQLDGIEGQLVQATRFLRAQGGEEFGVAQAVASEDETSVAPRCTVADAVGLQDHHIGDAALGQPEGRRQSGQPAAEDADTRVNPAGLGGEGWFLERGFVVRLGKRAVHQSILSGLSGTSGWRGDAFVRGC
ncbi:hypothetical protein D3C84_591380 [compost metagenome]